MEETIVCDVVLTVNPGGALVVVSLFFKGDHMIRSAQCYCFTQRQLLGQTMQTSDGDVLLPCPVQSVSHWYKTIPTGLTRALHNSSDDVIPPIMHRCSECLALIRVKGTHSCTHNKLRSVLIWIKQTDEFDWTIICTHTGEESKLLKGTVQHFY